MNAKAAPAKEPLPSETDAVDLPKPARKPKTASSVKPATKPGAKTAKREAPIAPLKT